MIFKEIANMEYVGVICHCLGNKYKDQARIAELDRLLG